MMASSTTVIGTGAPRFATRHTRSRSIQSCAPHPVTGRQALYVNEGFTTRIKDVPLAESDVLLAFLFKHMAQPQFHCRFHWRAHSMAFWDNRCTQHLAIWDYWPQTRHGYRVTIQGNRPFYKPVSD